MATHRYLLPEQLSDLLLVLFQFVLHLGEPGHRVLLPVVRSEVVQLGLRLAWTAKQTPEEETNMTVSLQRADGRMMKSQEDENPKTLRAEIRPKPSRIHSEKQLNGDQMQNFVARKSSE